MKTSLVKELLGELPKNTTFEYRKVEGRDVQFAHIGEDLVIPVFPSDEVDTSYLVSDDNGKPIKVIEPAQIG